MVGIPTIIRLAPISDCYCHLENWWSERYCTCDPPEYEAARLGCIGSIPLIAIGATLLLIYSKALLRMRSWGKKVETHRTGQYFHQWCGAESDGTVFKVDRKGQKTSITMDPEAAKALIRDRATAANWRLFISGQEPPSEADWARSGNPTPVNS